MDLDETRIVINFRILPSLKPRLEAAAARDRRSVSSWLERAIEASEHTTAQGDKRK
jgi:predicted HicB family RNase H-like nuclease